MNPSQNLHVNVIYSDEPDISSKSAADGSIHSGISDLDYEGIRFVKGLLFGTALSLPVWATLLYVIL